MDQLLETCELCNREKCATYTLLGIGVLGAALCPDCKKVAQTSAFKTELAHLLKTGQGDLEKFVRVHKIPRCTFCNTELKTSNWYESDRQKSTFRCKTCKKAHYPQKMTGKTAIGQECENIITDIHKAITLPNSVIFSEQP